MRRSARLLARLRAIGEERVERMESAVQLLRADLGDGQALAELRRELHTLKGEARVVGFSGVADVVHVVETVLGTEPTIARLDQVVAGLDVALTLLAAEPGPAAAAQRFAAEASERGFDVAESLLSVRRAPTSASTAAPPEPPAAPRPDDAPGESRASPHSGSTPSGLTPSDITPSGATPSAKARSRESGIGGGSTLRVSRERLTRLGAIAEAARLSRGEHLEAIGEIERSARAIDEARDAIRARVLQDRSLAPLLEHLDHGADAASAGLRHIRDADFDARIRLERLEGLVHELRLVPAASLLSGVRRAVRQMAAETGKQVHARVIGGESEADRGVLEAMADPLVHLLRNAIDHGLEATDQRVAAGKSPVGEITVTLRDAGAVLELEVADDGRGLDHGRIAQRALERGIVSEEALAEMEPNDVGRLIFLPGFSTRDEVGATSGRGIGLDVVAAAARELGGDVSVSSPPRGGTAFTVAVPASLVAIEAIVVGIGDARLALDCTWVQSIVDGHALPVEDVAGTETIRLDDQPPMRLRHLADLLSLPRAPVSRDRHPIVIVGRGESRLALGVEQLIGEQRLVRREPGLFLSGLGLLRGTALMDDGGLAMILDIPGLVELGDEFSGHVREARRRRVLVIDDSELLRTLVAQVVESMGHETVQAGDGQAGLEQALELIPDLIFTDLEMPRMDGFELLEAARESRELAHVPIVVFSTRGADVDQRRAVQLGADAYIVKGSLNQEAIRDAVARFLGARAL